MFQNKIIIVTGGSSGLGEALVYRFVKMGASVALIARNKNKLVKVRDALSGTCKANQKVEIFPCDISDFAATEKTIHTIAQNIGPPDILINSAGILKEGYFETLPISTFREVMDVNYFGVINCTRAVLPFFRQKGQGRIVNIASLGGRIASFGYTPYCPTKFALVGLTDTLRAELKPQNIKFHIVCPGEFESPMVDELNTYRTTENRIITQTVPVLPLDFVADQTIAGILKEQYLIIPGKVARLMDTLSRWFPSIGRVVIDYKISKNYQGPAN